MRIGVEASCWLNRRGYGRHARALFTEAVNLAPHGHNWVFFVDSTEALANLPRGVEVRLVNAAPDTRDSSSRPLRKLWRFSRALSDASLDVVVFPTAYSFVPVITSAHRIVFVHDVIPETYPHLTLPGLAPRLLWNAKIRLAIRQADTLATVSEYSRQGLARRFSIAESRIRVAGEAPDPIFRVLDHPEATPFLRDAGLDRPGRMIVYVGGFGPHKNVGALIQAFDETAGELGYEDVLLVLAGEIAREEYHSEGAKLRDAAGRSRFADRILFPGFVPDEDLVVLLNRASCLVLPSFIEGFGLPAVEAAACGCPVIATRNSPLPELLSEGGIYIDPHQPAELRAALSHVLHSEDLRRKLGMAAHSAVKNMCWKDAARQFLAMLPRAQ